MSGPIGHTYIYNIIILFIIIIFAFLAGTLSYYKAFKVNNVIVGSLEKFEGYSGLTKEEINQKLSNIGYEVKSDNCPTQYKNMALVTISENYNYCIYISDTAPKSGDYFNYGVLTYMKIDLPIINILKLPIFTRTNMIYKFTND